MAVHLSASGEKHAVQIKLMGIHKVRKKLADGSVRLYYYAWRGGPRIDAEPHTDAFVSEYVRLTRDRADAPYQGCMAELVRAYLDSPAYLNLKPSTKEGYDLAIRAIETEYYDMPLTALAEHGARSDFLQWRDGIAKTHPRKADLYMAVLRRILSYGYDREFIERHPLERVEKISDGSRRDIIWSDEEIRRFKDASSQPLREALTLALWTGQRQGDLLRLTWSAYDGRVIALKQEKTGKHVRIKVSKDLKAMLDGMERKAVTVLTNQRGRPWKSGFKSSWRKAAAKAGIEHRTFHDLRGTFCTWAYREGASFKEIAEASGHSEIEAETIIRKHYLVAEAVIEKIEARTKL